MVLRTSALLLLLALRVSTTQTAVERAKESWNCGTGGTTAAEALCNPQAIIEFYDGNLTPGLISDEVLFWYLGFVAGAPPPTNMSDAGTHLVQSTLQSLAQRQRDLHAREVARARSLRGLTEEAAQKLRAEGWADYLTTHRESREESRRALARFGRDFTNTDAVAFATWMESKRRVSVILVRDPSRMVNFDAADCAPLPKLPIRGK